MTLFPSAELQGMNPVGTVLSHAKASTGKEIVPEQELKMAALFFKELKFYFSSTMLTPLTSQAASMVHIFSDCFSPQSYLPY